MSFTLASAKYVENTVSKNVSSYKAKELVELYNDLLEFLNTVNAIGITGVQVGIPYRFSVYNVGISRMIFNASYRKIGKGNKVKHAEGCLTYPQKESKLVTRYDSILATYDAWNTTTQTLEPISRVISGAEAFVYAHEADHQNGITIYSF